MIAAIADIDEIADVTSNNARPWPAVRRAFFCA
jgi:hypothetical protein